MTDIVLYGHPESGHACKVALGLALAGVAHSRVFVDINRPRHARLPEFQRVSPLGEVPVMIMDHEVYYQSGAILLALADRFPSLQHGLARGRSLLMWEANRIGMCLPQLIGGGLEPAVADWLAARYAVDRDNFDRLLGGGPFFHGDRPGIGDAAIWGYVQWVDRAGVEASETMQGWIARMRALPQMCAPEAAFPAP